MAFLLLFRGLRFAALGCWCAFGAADYVSLEADDIVNLYREDAGRIFGIRGSVYNADLILSLSPGIWMLLPELA